MEDESNRRRGWAILTAKAVLSSAPSMIRVALIVLLSVLAATCSQMYADSSAELKALIDAGTLPECLYTYPLGLFGMVAAAVLILVVSRRWIK